MRCGQLSTDSCDPGIGCYVGQVSVICWPSICKVSADYPLIDCSNRVSPAYRSRVDQLSTNMSVKSRLSKLANILIDIQPRCWPIHQSTVPQKIHGPINNLKQAKWARYRLYIILYSCQIRDGSCGSDIFFKSSSLFRWSIYTRWFIRRWISLQVKSELNTSTAGNLLDLTCHYFIFVIINNIKMESIRKLSNFNFQWTKTLHQNNLNHIAFFFTFFKGYRCNQGCQKVLK